MLTILHLLLQAALSAFTRGWPTPPLDCLRGLFLFLYRRGSLGLASEEVGEAIEGALELYAASLGGERGAGEVPIVGFAISFEAEGALLIEQIAEVEVSYKIVGIGVLFPVSEVAIEQESVLEEAALQLSADLHVLPSQAAGGDRGAYLPVLDMEGLIDEVAKLAAQSAGKEALHGDGGLGGSG